MVSVLHASRYLTGTLKYIFLLPHSVKNKNCRYRGEEKKVDVDPPVIKYHLKLKSAALDDLDSDFKRIQDGLKIRV